jgi:hypothetical protein
MVRMFILPVLDKLDTQPTATGSRVMYLVNRVIPSEVSGS